jgi:hypothetical protein
MRRVLTVLLVVGGLALPAGAYAQSAGDEQYVDPFAGQGHQPQQQQQQQERQQPPAQQAPPAQSAPQQTAQATSQGADETASAAPASDQSSGDTLPRTGLRAGALALIGLIMLLAGTLVRSAARPLPRGAAQPPLLGRDVRLARRRR